MGQRTQTWFSVVQAISRFDSKVKNLKRGLYSESIYWYNPRFRFFYSDFFFDFFYPKSAYIFFQKDLDLCHTK
eukprot:SAG11_NODE_878_length_6760_cov_22.303558_4_plen_73_part_00